MQTIQLQNESIVEIATFLVRRWSEEDKMVIEISDKMETRTRLNEKKIILTPLEKRIVNDFQKYRQFRKSLLYESMRMKFFKKILSILIISGDISCSDLEQQIIPSELK